MLPHLLLDLTKLGKRSLCNRNKILNPERFHYPAASSRFFPQHKVGNTAHVPCKAIYTTTFLLLHVLAGSIGTIICGENIVSSGIQACVANVLIGSTSCSIWSHADKENSLVKRGEIAIYRSSLLPVSSLSAKVLPSLLQTTRSIEVCIELQSSSQKNNFKL